LNQNGSILDVLKGKESVKVEISLNTLSITLIGVTVFLAVGLAVFISKKL
jgi:hypothetical protein